MIIIPNLNFAEWKLSNQVNSTDDYLWAVRPVYTADPRGGG